MSNKKIIIKRAKSIGLMCSEMLKDDSDDESEDSVELEEDADTEQESVAGDTQAPGSAPDDGEEMDGEETEDEPDKEEDKDTDEDIEARAGTAGFIPISKPYSSGSTGKIVTRQTLMTATYRTKEGREHNPTNVVGVGPGTLRIESELNEDGTNKKKQSPKYQSCMENSMWFYRGSLNDEKSGEIPLKTGIRQTDSSHLQW